MKKSDMAKFLVPLFPTSDVIMECREHGKVRTCINKYMTATCPKCLAEEVVKMSPGKLKAYLDLEHKPDKEFWDKCGIKEKDE